MTLTTAKRFSLDEYHQLTDLGFFKPGDRIELVRGEIISMAAKGRAHETCNRRLSRELSALLGNLATLQHQAPITIPTDGEPEPDLAIVRNRPDDYLAAHPLPADILLVIEIADSSLTYDRETKLPLYAEAQIPDYWLFNLSDYVLEAYAEPLRKLNGQFDYRTKRIVLPAEALALPPFPSLILDLSKVFPGRVK
ncbi:MAG: Uma2 family endonuclease [Aphanocapsa sp. GSE-SYN-MK-11-07L]|jgi:Uma2 family endonuclease|nr:Uma2 family endonuclease [Aphanocapsa sp. GSE-SYN-MK-11-07L]